MEEDLHPHLILWVQVHHSRPRCYIMVPCVGVKGFNTILAVLHQTNSQVFVGQCNVIGEKVNTWVRTYIFACLWVVVTALIKKDLVELDGSVFCRIAASDSHREG